MVDVVEDEVGGVDAAAAPAQAGGRSSGWSRFVVGRHLLRGAESRSQDC